ncbi:MAG TPA: hypothetical protein VKO63_05290, partial [Chitinispirillaceae bacterium]|nr:hypothetical protein [Chitinispirillaceae bacterium]
FDVVDPRRSASSFHVFDQLDRKVDITYSAADQKYQIVMGPSDPRFTVAQSTAGNVRYAGWYLTLNSYTFGTDGVLLTNFDVEPNSEIFPVREIKDTLTTWNNHTRTTRPVTIQLNGSTITGFSGCMIKGKEDVAFGALLLYGSATAQGDNVTLQTHDLYKFNTIESFTFAGNQNGDDFTINMNGTQKTIDAPVGFQKALYFEGENENGYLPVPLTSCELSPDGIKSLDAQSIVNFKHGVCNNAWSLNFSTNLRLKYVDRAIIPVLNKVGGTDPEENIDITFDPDFFVPHQNPDGSQRTVSISKSKLIFRNDYSIYSLYARESFLNSEPVQLRPLDAPVLMYSSRGLSLEKESDSLLLRLNNPKFESLDIANAIAIPAHQSMQCAVFGLNKKIDYTSAALSLSPENNSIKGIPFSDAFIDKIADINVNTLYLDYNDGDASHPLKLGAEARLTFGSLFKFIGLEGSTIKIDDMQIGLGKVNDKSSLKLDRLIASNGDNAFSFDIAKNDFNANQSDDPLVELFVPSQSIKVVCSNGDDESGKNDKVTFTGSNWSIKFTDYFPVVGFRGLSFSVDNIEYVKEGTAKGYFKTFEGSATIRKDRMELFDGAVLTGVTLSVKGGSNSNTDAKKADPPEVPTDAYIGASFTGIEINGVVYNVAANLKIYFDGDVEGKVTIPYTGDINIYLGCFKTS